MKRIILSLLVLTVIFSSVTVFAGVKHFVHGVDIQLELPEGFDVITREVEEDNPLISVFGDSAEEAKGVMESEELYLFGTDYDKYTVGVSMTDDEDNLNVTECSNMELGLLAATMQKGTNAVSVDIAEHPQIKFFRMEIVNEENAQIAYTTMQGGNQLIVYVIALDKEITSEMDEFAENVFNSIYLSNSTFGEGWKNITKEDVTTDTDIEVPVVVWAVILAVFCIAPVIIYRFGIRKRPLSRYAAKWVAAIIAIILLIVFGILGVYSANDRGLKWVAVLCQIVNYGILAGGKNRTAAQQTVSAEVFSMPLLSDEDDVQSSAGSIEESVYNSTLTVCKNCGTELLNGCKSCYNCGCDCE